MKSYGNRSHSRIIFHKAIKYLACHFWTGLMEAIVNQAKHLANSSEKARYKLIEAFRSLPLTLASVSLIHNIPHW